MYTLQPRFQFYDEVVKEIEDETYVDDDDGDGFSKPYDIEGARLAQLDEDMKYELVQTTWDAGLSEVNDYEGEPTEGYPIPESYVNKIKNLLQIKN